MKSLLLRPALFEKLKTAIGRSPVTALLGPRQCGKTTLAKEFVQQFPEVTWLDLESPQDMLALRTPQTFLEGRKGLVVIDEVQRMPELFPLLRVLADRRPSPASFLLLGSSSPDLMRGAGETLAGRVEFLPMGPFSLGEVDTKKWQRLWVRGGFPRSFLAANDNDSMAWRNDFLTTFVERDLRTHGIELAPAAFRRFWAMLAHYHGQTLNVAELSSSFGIHQNTTRRYIDILEGAFMLRQLQPWHENIGKRQVKSPKLYVRDSGLWHALMGYSGQDALWSSPKIGASFEGFALEQLLTATSARDAYFWSVQGSVELDLLLNLDGKRHGFEMKWSEQPDLTRSMRTAIADLQLHHLWVVYPGKHRVQAEEKITLLPIQEVAAGMQSFLVKQQA